MAESEETENTYKDIIHREDMDIIPSGLGLFSCENGLYVPLYFNDRYFEMMHTIRKVFFTHWTFQQEFCAAKFLK